MNPRQFKTFMNVSLQALDNLIKHDLPVIVGTEAKNHFREGFDKEGFTDKSLVKWKPRKERRRKDGSMSAKERTRVGRKILTGETGELSKIESEPGTATVKVYTEASYAKFHNDGTDKLPQRQFMGESQELNQKIEKVILEEVEKLLLP